MDFEVKQSTDKNENCKAPKSVSQVCAEEVNEIMKKHNCGFHTRTTHIDGQLVESQTFITENIENLKGSTENKKE